MVLALQHGRRVVTSLLVSRHRLPVLLSSSSYFHDWKNAPHVTHQPLHSRWFSHASIENKYDRFRRRRRLLLKSSSSSLDSDSSFWRADDDESSLLLAEEAISVLAQKNRTWKRLRHIVQLAVSTAATEANPNQTIADIGCDHGLLSIALACTGKFTTVIGTDVSARALQDGALAYQTKLEDILSTSQQLPNVQFRIGNGLEPLYQMEHQVNAICIAGMGINTMLKILLPSSNHNLPTQHFANCTHLYLQPTNSRPKNLLILYTELQNIGWILQNERIEYSSSRWYITSSFSFQNTPTNIHQNQSFKLPGEYLSKLPNHSRMKQIYDDYVQYHTSWLDKDKQRKGTLSHQDMLWLEHTRNHT